MFKNSEKGTSCRQILPALVWSKAALMIVVLFTVSLDGVTVFAHEAEDRPVVMFSSAPFRIPIADPIADGNEVDKFVPYTIYREIVRQAVMIIVREEFGLPTRDDSLLEPLDNTSKHYYEIDVVVHHLKSVTYTISQNGKVKLEKKFE